MKNIPKLIFTNSCVLLFKFSGAQWLPIYTFPSCPLSIASSANRIYICTAISGVFVSTDMGMTFTESNNGLTDLNTRYMITRDSLLLLGTSTGVFRSTDYGNTWNVKYDVLGPWLKSIFFTDTLEF